MEHENKVTHTPGPWKLSNPTGGPAYRILGGNFPQGGPDSIVGDLLNLDGDQEHLAPQLAVEQPFIARPDGSFVQTGVPGRRRDPLGGHALPLAGRLHQWGNRLRIACGCSKTKGGDQ